MPETSPSQDATLATQLAHSIRVLAMDAVEQAKSGHPGLPLGFADVATILFGEFVKLDPLHPDWPDRDRFVLSAGHGSMLQYALHYLLGYEDMTLSELRNFRQLDAKTAGHPEHGLAAGIETTTGPLGQGLANAVGMALAERLLNARFGDGLVNHHTYVIASDGDLMEGISHEAISMAGHLGLHKLIVLFDDNGISIDGPTSLTESGDVLARFAAAGWVAERIDGHEHTEIRSALRKAHESTKPTLIACKTTIGKFSPKAGQAAAHGAPLGKDNVEKTRTQLGWAAPPFEIPPEILDAWRMIGRRHTKAHRDWTQRLQNCKEELRTSFTQMLQDPLPQDIADLLYQTKRKLLQDPKPMATRVASQQVLNALVPHIPAMIGGSADLTGSNNTKADTHNAITAQAYDGQFVHYGVREHAMGSIMNGLALHGGIIPYSGTFLVFSDYMRPAIRLAALMRQRVIYVLTHDSIGLGEDGPTHQPIEHLAALRAIPHLRVFRPADAVETAECWSMALQYTNGPSILALSRQALPPLRDEMEKENLCAPGAYVLAGGELDADIHLIATGSELHLAADARDVLESEGHTVRLVSVPCLDILAAKPTSEQNALLGRSGLRVIIEAGIRQCWDRYLRQHDIFIGLDDFGVSAPGEDVFKHFSLTSFAIAKRVRDRLEQMRHDKKKEKSKTP